MAKITKEAALLYHSQGKPGKIEVVPTKPYSTQTDLSLAYSPGVAEPCLEIEKNPQDAYKYTAKGNLVAVISNGTAVLGLGDIGALSGKPVMEGKGLLFKIYAGIEGTIGGLCFFPVNAIVLGNRKIISYVTGMGG